MKKLIFELSKYLLLWFIVFFVQRNVFLIYFLSTTSVNLKEWINVQKNSFFIDISTLCYFIIPVLLIFIVHSIVIIRLISQIIKYYTISVIIISNLILISDIGLFKEWGIKINNKALSYLIYPNEVISSVKVAPVYELLLIFALTSISMIFIFYRLKIKFDINEIKKVKKVLLSIVLLIISFVGLRGGLQTFPIDRSWSYFSEKTLLNQAAVNSTWNFFASFTEKEEFDKNPYNFFNNTEVEKIFASLTTKEQDKTISILNNQKPNIVFILLEGWSAEAVGVLSKEIDASPRFSELTKTGLLFTNFISTGFRTEQALAAITAGFPSQPKTTIIRKYGKFENLPSFVKDLYNNGYNTSYYYGGDLYFANTEAYLKSAGFKKIIGQKNFEGKPFTEWGVFDHDLFDYTLKDLKNNSQPFFAMIMTSTSHEPFTHKVPKVFKGNTIVDDYKNVVHYSDDCMYQFIKNSKSEGWYNNTLFIIVTDHTHRLPNNRQSYDIERHWIPCLLYGPSLKNEYIGKTVDFPVSHIDIAATILAQLNLSYNKYKWSKNVFSSNYKNPWAFYTFDEGFGFLKNNDKIIYDIKQNKLLVNTNTDSLNTYLTREGKVLLQKLLDDYIELSK